jgi:four helix bundle protein
MRNYRDLKVWERAHTLTLAVYKGTQCFPSEERFGLTSQIRRSCSSIPASLAEGCGRRSDGEMARYVQIAMGSGAELSYHLLPSRDLGLLGGGEYTKLETELSGIMRMLSGLSQKVRSARGAWVSSQEPTAKSQKLPAVPCCQLDIRASFETNHSLRVY